MKTAFKLLALALPLAFVSCSNATSSGTPTVSFPISYIVESTGATVTVAQVQYIDGAGQSVTELNPTLPWVVNDVLPANATAQLVVSGTTGATSTLTARIQDDPAEVTTPITYAEVTCLENTNPCDVDISNIF